MKHAILGGGIFTHAHIRVTNEITDSSNITVFKRHWSQDQKHKFEIYSNVDSSVYTRDNVLAYNPDIIHIVTPDDSHLPYLVKFSNSTSCIFLEKPSVVIGSIDDLKTVLNIPNNNIYYNNWFAHVTDSVPNKSLHFKYYTQKHITKSEIVNQVLTHLVSYLINIGIAPTCSIDISNHTYVPNGLQAQIHINNITMYVDISTGTNEKSQWSLQVDNRIPITSNDSKGNEMRQAFKSVYNKTQPAHHWVDSAILTSRLHYQFNSNSWSIEMMELINEKN